MDDEDRFKAWASYAEISRKWALAMDAKAGFVSALNLGLLAALWSGAKIQDGGCLTRWLGSVATVCSILSILFAIWAALPRQSLKDIFGKGMRWHGDYKPLSYYGYVAQAYGRTDFAKLLDHAKPLDHCNLAEEALEQHFVISHAVSAKAGFVKLAGILLMVGVFLTGAAVISRLAA
jgi:hypothetical protein